MCDNRRQQALGKSQQSETRNRSEEKSMKGVLEGIRILELGNFISGPYAAALLADMGAEVIKVENPKGGDPFRGWDLGR